jgi:uncharacterized membrane protein
LSIKIFTMRNIYYSKWKMAMMGSVLLGGLSFAQVFQLTNSGTISGNDVSDNGVVVLSNTTANYMWTEAGGLVTINSFTNGTNNAGNPAVSNDGSVISATVTNPGNNLNEMGLYNVGTGAWTYLGGIGGSSDGSSSSAWSMSGDGQIVVGLGWVNAGTAHAISWSQATGMVDMGSTVEGRSSRANDANLDGSKIVGWQDAETGFRQAAIWDNGVQTLIYDADGFEVGEAGAISEDGNWVIGGGHMNMAWKWSEATGLQTIDHPDAGMFFRGSSTAISADGSVVVGYYRPWPGGPYFGEGFIWTEETGRVNLNDYVDSLGIDRLGISFNLPLGISSDGKMIVGGGLNANNEIVSFLIKLPTEQEEEECEWTVTINCPGFGDEVSWELRNESGVIISGGNYAEIGQIDIQTVTAAGPIEFYIETMGEWGDNGVTYSIANGNGTLINETIQGGNEATHSDMNCEDEGEPSNYNPCAPVHTGTPTNGVGFVNNGTEHYVAANDFNVLADTQFTVQKITLDVVTLGGEPTTFDISFREGETGVGAQIGETIEGVIPSAITPNGTFGSTGFPVYTIELTLPNAMLFQATATADKKYWVAISGYPSVENNTVYWVSSAYAQTETMRTWQSADGGATWAQFESSVEGVMSIEGECATLGLTDVTHYDFAYYPNPTKEFVNIESQKAVESVQVYNLAGQLVLRNTRVMNGKINVQGLSSGTYVFRVSLEGGQIETFKIIKN